MLLRSGFEYTALPPTSRKRKAQETPLNERPLKRQDTAATPQVEHPSSLSVSPRNSSKRKAQDGTLDQRLPKRQDTTAVPQVRSSLSVVPPAALSVVPSAGAAASSSAVPVAVVSSAVPVAASSSAVPVAGVSSSVPVAVVSSAVPFVLQQEPPTSADADPLVGKIVGQEFELLRLLGQGGFGCVYVGQSVKDKSYVAVKVLKEGSSARMMELQQMEIDIHQSLQHPNIVSLRRVVRDGESVYMVMELCAKGDLLEYLSDGVECESAAEYGELVKQLFSQILSAVEAMHAKGIYHCDLKAENVFLQAQGNDDRVVCKVGDFGLATRERFTMGFGRGTAAYMAPEHFDASKHSGPADAAAADVWALGIVLLKLMYGGRDPWEVAADQDSFFCAFKGDPSTLAVEYFYGDLSPAADRLLVSMLALDAADRPSVSNVKEQFAAIDRLFADEADTEQ